MQNHVCVVLRRLTKEVYVRAIDGTISDANIDIFRSVGKILSQILLVNQMTITFIHEKVDTGTGIDHYVRSIKYDLDEIWRQSEEIIDSPVEYSNKLTSYYSQLYRMLKHIGMDEGSKMIGYVLNGLYLGLILETEIKRLYDDDPDIFDKIYSKGLSQNPRFRPTFFKTMSDKCEKVGRSLLKDKIFVEITELQE